ncbi:murein DD-endopeptidase MepM [Dongshaea marina]|uniref:murein DD-endopeptidase MepM n=1 Tax=Dongshaea marina TaxID=2047966 RepID=UPI000D3E8B75|nr:murein DD-endopeptidase MepM [Dongshaea marina]
MTELQKQRSTTTLPFPINKRILISLVTLVCLCAIVIQMLPSSNRLLQQSSSIPLAAIDAKPEPATTVTASEGSEKSSTAPQTAGGDDHDYAIPDKELLKEPVTDKLDDLALSEGQWQNYEVQRGDTLSGILSGLGLSNTDLYRLLATDKNHQLSTLRPGQNIDLLIDKDNQLQKLELRVDLAHSLIFTRTDNGFSSELTKQASHWKSSTITGVVTDNFYNSASRSGLTPGQIHKIAELFQWKVNFSRDFRKGDRFEVLLDKEVIQGKQTGDERIIGVQLLLAGKTYSAYRFRTGEYYDERGYSLNRAFRRYPFKGHYRISSPFNLHRVHPVTHRISPHYGTDFALPVGTPVLATGDGEVVFAGYQRYAGNYIVVRYGRKYSTRYLHLSKLLVKKGDKVNIGQKIALSGNTGRTTGPHLHYEVRIYNRPVNPMTVKLPMSRSIDQRDRSRFLAEVSKYQKEMNS